MCACMCTLQRAKMQRQAKIFHPSFENFTLPQRAAKTFLNKNANIVNTIAATTTITKMKTNAFVFAEYGAKFSVTFGFVSKKD